MALKECSMSKRAYKTYTKEFKLEAIRLADESGKPVTQVARELGLRVNQIYKWKEQGCRDPAFKEGAGSQP